MSSNEFSELLNDSDDENQRFSAHRIKDSDGVQFGK